VNELVADPERARALGRAGRRRAVERFAWPAIAERTVELYRRVSAGRAGA
jgi:starch synthase